MTPTERGAYNAGINAAQITALTIETGKDAGSFCKRVTAKALAAFAESARELMLPTAADTNSENSETTP